MRNINQDIKECQFKKMYLLYGTEGYLRKQYRDKIRTAICGDDTMNYAYFEGKGINVDEVISIADTMPFFAERRLVVIENSGFFKNANEKMVDYIDQLPESTILLFVEEEADKRGKLFKKVKELGYVCELSEQSPAILAKWISGMVRAEQKQMSNGAIEYLLAATGTDMNYISTEMEKLFSYTIGKDEITIEDINAVGTTMIVSKVFEMIDAMGSKNRRKALKLYYDMIETKEPPMRILYMMSRQFNIMLQVWELRKNGMDGKEIASKLSMQPFVVNKAIHQIEKFKVRSVIHALEECIRVDEDVKNGKLDDKIGVEMILVRYSS